MAIRLALGCAPTKCSFAPSAPPTDQAKASASSESLSGSRRPRRTGKSVLAEATNVVPDLLTLWLERSCRHRRIEGCLLLQRNHEPCKRSKRDLSSNHDRFGRQAKQPIATTINMNQAWCR